MTDNLNPQPDQKVLEIGTGSGYQSAFLSELCRHVYTVEIVRPLALETDAIYRKHEAAYPELGNINRKVDDGYYGWAEHAPFDRITILSAAFWPAAFWERPWAWPIQPLPTRTSTVKVLACSGPSSATMK